MAVALTNAYDSERIARLLKSSLESELADVLDLVEARWADEAPITLPDPVTFTIGFNPDLLDLYSASFPIVSVIPGERDPAGTALWGSQQHQAVIDIHFFVVADTYANVHLYAYRYAEAITRLLQDHHYIGNHEQQDYKPSVEMGISARHPVSGYANMNPSGGGTDYVMGGRVTITLKAG